MVLPIEQKDVVIDLSKPAPVSMTNLLNLTHTTTSISPLGEEILDVSITEGEPQVQPNSMLDDNRWKAMAAVLRLRPSPQA